MEITAKTIKDLVKKYKGKKGMYLVLPSEANLKMLTEYAKKNKFNLKGRARKNGRVF